MANLMGMSAFAFVESDGSRAKLLVPDHKVTHFPALITCRYSRDFLSKLLRDDASILPRESLSVARISLGNKRRWDGIGRDPVSPPEVEHLRFGASRIGQGRSKMKQIYGNLVCLTGAVECASAHAIRIGARREG